MASFVDYGTNGFDSLGGYWERDGVRVRRGDRVAFKFVDEVTVDDSQAFYRGQCAGVVVALPRPPGNKFKIDIDEYPEGWDHEGDELGYYASPLEILGLLPASMGREDVEGWLVQ